MGNNGWDTNKGIFPKDPLFRLLVINGLTGTLIAGLVLVGIFWANIGNLRVLILAADNPVLPVVMLAVGLVITLGSVVIGSAIMLLEKGDQGSSNRGGGLSGLLHPELKPIPITIETRGRHQDSSI